jgi:ABC-type transporter Mla subunit MlaD
VIGRVAALVALPLVVVAVGFILLSGGSSYEVKAIFQNASQIVSGDEVQVAGNAIGGGRKSDSMCVAFSATLWRGAA